MKVSITGHRRLSDTDLIIVRDRMVRMVRDVDVDEVFFGGAIGADTDALRFALQHRRGKGLPFLTVIVPDTLDMQAISAQIFAKKADRVVELRNRITAVDGYASFKTRNRFLVDQIKNCGELVAFWSGDWKSGTGSAVRYAQQVDAAWEHVEVSGGAE